MLFYYIYIYLTAIVTFQIANAHRSHTRETKAKSEEDRQAGCTLDWMSVTPRELLAPVSGAHARMHAHRKIAVITDIYGPGL